MSELWDSLTTGLIVSLVLLALSYLFWRRYDRPTPLMIEREEEKARLKEEQKTWRQVEARMRAEAEEAEQRAAYERRKAEERARATVPATSEVTDAWKSLGVSSPAESQPRFEVEAGGEDANASLRATDATAALAEVSEDDRDVLNVNDLVQVRQDLGVQAEVSEPDWKLIEKLNEIAERDDEESEATAAEVPEAPDLEAFSSLGSESADSTSSDDVQESDAPEPSLADGEDELKSGEITSDEPNSGEITSDEPKSGEIISDELKSGEITSNELKSGETPFDEPKSVETSDGVSWGLAEGEDLWAGTSWEEE